MNIYYYTTSIVPGSTHKNRIRFETLRNIFKFTPNQIYLKNGINTPYKIDHDSKRNIRNIKNTYLPLEEVVYIHFTMHLTICSTQRPFSINVTYIDEGGETSGKNRRIPSRSFRLLTSQTKMTRLPL